ncbi:hypothetical protein HanRHA438_Chr15g0708491 [Helianthus annuus]|uniref:Uncharacterized protein n=1 Tax=Helianthus annuus TaxID=4232 RepID=A0A251S8R7_HELAN|nr:hypothetical protein HanRHA438_Chr15g0708491 [Helianthus annuus]
MLDEGHFPSHIFSLFHLTLPFSLLNTHPHALNLFPPFTFFSHQNHANNRLRIELRPPLKTTGTTCSDLNPSHRRTSPNHVCSGQKTPNHHLEIGTLATGYGFYSRADDYFYNNAGIEWDMGAVACRDGLRVSRKQYRNSSGPFK